MCLLPCTADPSASHSVWESGWWPQCLQDIATRQLMFVTFNQPMTSPRACEPPSLCYAPYVKVIYAQGITELVVNIPARPSTLVSLVISVYSATPSVPFSNNTNNLLWMDLLFVDTSQLIKLGSSQDELHDVVCYSEVVLRFWEESYTTDSRCSGLSPSVALFCGLITSYCLKDSEIKGHFWVICLRFSADRTDVITGEVHYVPPKIDVPYEL